MRLLLPIASLCVGYYIAEGADYVPPSLPQGERYVSAQLFGVPDTPAHMVIAAMPSRRALLGERAIDEIVVTKRVKRVPRDYGWDPEREFQKFAKLGSGAKLSPMKYANKCPIPEEIWRAISELEESAEVKAIIAGAGWVESKWDVDCHHYDNDGGYAHGWLCLHSKWRAEDVTWMGSQPGGWRNARVNLEAFLRTIRAHEKYYPDSKKSWKLKLARYNGGSRANLKYANKCLAKAEELKKWFG